MEAQIQTEFQFCCLRGDLAQAKKLYSKTVHPIVSRTARMVLMSACYQGHWNVVSWMFSSRLAHITNNRSLDEDRWDTLSDNFETDLKRILVKVPRDASSQMLVAKWLLSLASCNKVNKWKEYALFSACCGGYLQLAQWICQGTNISEMSNYSQQGLFEMACKGGLDVAHMVFTAMPDIDEDVVYKCFLNAFDKNHLKFARWWYALRSKSDSSDAAAKRHESVELCAFQDACSTGRIQIAQWIFKRNPLGLGVSKHLNQAFWNACGHGHLDVAKWLLSLTPSIENDLMEGKSDVFKSACRSERPRCVYVAQWLVTLNPFLFEIDLDETGTKIVAYRVRIEENARWQKRKVALWMGSDIATNITIFNRLPEDVSRWIVEYI